MSAAAQPETATYLTVDQATINRTAHIFDSIEPFSGTAPARRSFNFAGTLLPEFKTKDWPSAAVAGMRHTTTPTIDQGEGFAEWYSIVRSIELAHDDYLMISLGAHFGGPIVNTAKILERYRPMPARYVAVEADEHMCAMFREHVAENDLDSASVTLTQAVISDTPRPMLFTVCTEPTGANTMVVGGSMDMICTAIQENDLGEKVAEALLRRGTTDLRMTLPGTDGIQSDLKLVSALTVADIVGPHRRVDYLEIDIQSAEYFALPLAIDLLDARVAWLHLGTHGHVVHDAMRQMFNDHGWEIDMDWLPNSTYMAPGGQFDTSDGVLAMRNPRIT
jgi:FkbM family methyltransferase